MIATEPNAKWIRGLRDGATIVDSTRSTFVWEHRYWPAWFFPPSDIAAEVRPSAHSERRGERAGVVHYDLVVDGEVLPGAARGYPDSSDPELAGLISVDWNVMDQWLEEDTEAIVHPRSPHVRVDALPSSRHVVVRVDGHVVADSRRPTVLFETGLPPRYYLPVTDVATSLLAKSDTVSSCPYKGHARYWSLHVGDAIHDDAVWAYPDPLPESRGVAGLMCFYNERVEIEVDGETQERPHTKFA